MRHPLRSAAFALAGIFALVAPVSAQVAPPRDPIVQAGTTKKIADHVFVIPDDNVGVVPNVGFVVGARAALVIDTGLGERNGRTVLAEAEKLAPGKTLYLVTTHVHPEHDLGASAFPASTKLIRSTDQIAEIADTGLNLANTFASRSPAMAELLKGAQFRKADITFAKSYALDLGGVMVRLLAMGPNHTRGDTAIFVEQDRVLFSGDVAMKGPPALTSPASSVAHWQESLTRLEALKPAIVVPSHGPIGDSSLMAGYRAYFAAIQTSAAAAKKRSESVEEAVKTISAALAPQFPQAGARMAPAIRAAYSEAR